MSSTPTPSPDRTPGEPIRTRREGLRRLAPRRGGDLLASLRRREVLNAAWFVLLAGVIGVLLDSWAASRPPVQIGRVALEDHLNPIDYEVVDLAATEAARAESRKAAPRLYRVNTPAMDRLRAAVLGLPVAVQQKSSLAEIDPEFRADFALTDQVLARLQPYADGEGATPEWRSKTEALLRSLWADDPMLAAGEYQLFATTARREVVPPPDSGATPPLPLRGAIDLAGLDSGALERSLSRLADRAGFPASLVPSVIAPILRDPPPTILFDADLTATAAELAAMGVAEVRVKHPRNELIVARGDVVSPEAYARLAESIRAADAQETLSSRILRVVGSGGLVAAIAALVVAYLLGFYPSLLRNHWRVVGLLAVTFGAAAIGVLGAVELPWGGAFGATFAAMVGGLTITLCYDRRLGAVAGGLLVATIALSTERSIGFPVAIYLTAMVAVAGLADVRDRAAVFRAGAYAALAGAVLLLLLGLSESPRSAAGWLQVLTEMAVSATAAMLAAVFILGVLPGVERLFGVSTGLTLGELRDPRQPLLRLLQERAPGTASHSLQVASMAEAAADAIGANGLLAYVGALYHDVGKIHKPEYFIENQRGGPNRHDRLSPAMSVLVILGHVKDGLALAREHRLPRALQHFIESHHGTTLVEYFYRQAKERASSLGEEPSSVQEHDFRYPGPKPRTREAAILMLCDASESTVRSLHDPSAARIEAVVREIATRRLEDGQFDDCAMTFRELRVVEDSIIKSLVASRHARIEYPSSPSPPSSPSSATSVLARQGTG